MSAPSISSFSVIVVTCYRRKIWLLYLFLAIYKAGAVWISLRSMLGRARGTRVFDISSFATPSPCQKKKWRPLRSLWLGAYSRTLAQNEPVENGPGAGEINVQSCYTGSSVMSSKILKSRHLRKFQTMLSSSMRKLHYSPLWQCSELTCTWTVAAWRLHTPFSLGITAYIHLSLGGCQSDGMLQNWL